MSRSLGELRPVEKVLVAWCVIPLAAVPFVVLFARPLPAWIIAAAALWLGGALGLAWRADRNRGARKNRAP